MKRFTKEEIEYLKENAGKVVITKIAEDLNRDYRTVVNKIRQLKLTNNERGKSPFSRAVRKYGCKDNFFETPNLLNSYWAGFIAADGYINSKTGHLNIMLAIKDLNHLLCFRDALNSTKPLCKSISNNFEMVSLSVTSDKIAVDLFRNFKITPRKSLTLEFPKFENDALKDAFIIGYVDGDGCIMHNKNTRLTISVVGTFQVLSSIKQRFDEILGENSCHIYQDRNHFNLVCSNRFAREVFKHYYRIGVPKLARKWSKEKYDYSVNYREPREKIHPREFEKIKYMYFVENRRQKDIAKTYNVHQFTISRIVRGIKDNAEKEYKKQKNCIPYKKKIK